MENLLNVELYTDGACSGNPGPGGWAYLLICKGKEKTESGYSENTTNNIMELTAVIKGLEAINKPCNLTIYSDSAYVCNAFIQDWITTWQNNGFITTKKTNVLNKDLWLKLIDLLKIHNYKFVKVTGHSNNIYNNFCDKLATSEIKKHKEEK